MMNPGTLYIVSTPIGNLDDMTHRAVDVLSKVDLIAAEDTRHSQTLIRHYGISTPMVALYSYNESKMTEKVLDTLNKGLSVALISDAGTPLISDPGYKLVMHARAQAINVLSVPGPCALIAALSVSGLPTESFVFEGFLPTKNAARLRVLEALKKETRTWVGYEAPHRILNLLEHLSKRLQPERSVVLARELTKRFETVLTGTASYLLAELKARPEQQKGEFVVLVEGVRQIKREDSRVTLELDDLLDALKSTLSVKEAAKLAAELTGYSKNELYKRLLDTQ